MGKCVKCGRCVEVCQEVQTIRAINSSHRSVKYEISTAYGQTLSDSPCIFCGQCALVCPVGAIYERDETAKVWDALNNKERDTAVQISPAAAPAMCGEFGLPSGTITPGMLVTALNRLGFGTVFDAGKFTDMTIADGAGELFHRIKNKLKLPIIFCCLPGWNKFMEVFYPDLLDHLPVSGSPERTFRAFVKERFSRPSTFISVMPCIAKKFAADLSAASLPAANSSGDEEIILTTGELARIIRLAGIDLPALPESGFTTVPGNGIVSKTVSTGIEAFFWKVFEAYDNEKRAFDFTEQGIKKIEQESEGSKMKALIVNGLANSRAVMDAIRKGECDADFVGIMGCPGGCTQGNP
jgi:NADH-quinone oxidoreductase subunit G/NADP-reducing hydrogenase subunit HndD